MKSTKKSWLYYCTGEKSQLWSKNGGHYHHFRQGMWLLPRGNGPAPNTSNWTRSWQVMLPAIFRIFVATPSKPLVDLTLGSLGCCEIQLTVFRGVVLQVTPFPKVPAPKIRLYGKNVSLSSTIQFLFVDSHDNHPKLVHYFWTMIHTGFNSHIWIYLNDSFFVGTPFLDSCQDTKRPRVEKARMVPTYRGVVSPKYITMEMNKKYTFPQLNRVQKWEQFYGTREAKVSEQGHRILLCRLCSEKRKAFATPDFLLIPSGNVTYIWKDTIFLLGKITFHGTI